MILSLQSEALEHKQLSSVLQSESCFKRLAVCYINKQKDKALKLEL